jgi:inosose dehydratase
MKQYTGVLSAQSYMWEQPLEEAEVPFFDHLDDALKEAAESGFNAWDMALRTDEDASFLAPKLSTFGLSAPSVYIGGCFHKNGDVEELTEMFLRRACEARDLLGTKIITTNPDPIDWKGTENKNDEELVRQSSRLNELGAILNREGLRLAYHMHDAEFRCGAREFYHMLSATDPSSVDLCLDAHWIYRGSGNSLQAVLDVTRVYGDRISVVHVRQSHNSAWSEAFDEGDLDYEQVASAVYAVNPAPLIVVEQCCEPTERSRPMFESCRSSVAYARRLFPHTV